MSDVGVACGVAVEQLAERGLCGGRVRGAQRAAPEFAEQRRGEGVVERSQRASSGRARPPARPRTRAARGAQRRLHRARVQRAQPRLYAAAARPPPRLAFPLVLALAGVAPPFLARARARPRA